MDGAPRQAHINSANINEETTLPKDNQIEGDETTIATHQAQHIIPDKIIDTPKYSIR